MAKMFCEDAYCLGLLYSYLYAGKKMVLKDDLDSFYDTIENNLKDSDAMDMYANIWYDNDPSIYYSSEGKNGEVYYVLYPDFDIERAKSKYIGCLYVQVLLATQENNALNCLDLQKIDGNIRRKENIKVGMVSTPTFMKKFLEKLKSGELKIETCPQLETGEELTQEYIEQQLEKYQRLLDSGIIDTATRKEYGQDEEEVVTNYLDSHLEGRIKQKNLDKVLDLMDEYVEVFESVSSKNQDNDRILYVRGGNGITENWNPELACRITEMLNELRTEIKEEQGPVKKLTRNKK